MIKSFQVIDQFLDAPGAVRDSAIFAGFGNWNPGQGSMSETNLDGIGFVGNHATPIAALIKAMGLVVVPNLTHFRLTTKNTARATIHSDAHAAAHTCIVYLTQNKNQGSTAFWRHKETGLTSLPDNLSPEIASMLKDDMAKSHTNDWEIVDLVSGEYNRALIFNGLLFHSRFPMEDPGVDTNDGRLIWVTHFEILQEMK